VLLEFSTGFEDYRSGFTLGCAKVAGAWRYRWLEGGGKAMPLTSASEGGVLPQFADETLEPPEEKEKVRRELERFFGPRTT